MSAIFNFSAGPAMLPDMVLEQAQRELLNWKNSGISVMEFSHRSPEFLEVARQSEQDLRELLSIPDNYAVLFMHGGAQTQFSAVPMNLLAGHKTAAYVQTGVWGQLAIEEAKRFCEVNVVANAQHEDYTTIPKPASWADFSDAAYLYYVDNETVNGLEFDYVPQTGDVPLVADMSSSLLTKPIDVTQYGLIYACSQKNLGPAGVTVVIVRKDLLKHEPLAHTPKMLRYALHDESGSMVNTPTTFSWYMAGLVFKWVKLQGGVAKMDERNRRKSAKLYAFIDNSDFYINSVESQYRSRMNVIFRLKDESKDELFLTKASDAGLKHLKGHRLTGGMRASIYNAMPEEAVDALIQFMSDFEKQHGKA